MQFAAAMTTAQKSGQQQLSAPDCSLDRGAAFASGVVGDHALIPLELLPGDVGLVMILDQNIPFGHRPMHATPHALAPLLDAHLARRAPEGIGAGVDRIGQNVVHDIVGRQSPDNPARLAVARLHRQLDAFVAQPDVDLTCALELGKLCEDKLQCIPDALVRILLDPITPDFDIAGSNTEDQRTAARLLLQRLLRTLAKQRQLKLAHRPLHPK
jgi:hypothetical protein